MWRDVDPGMFKRCGRNVRVAADVYIEHPQVMELGDNVTFMKGVYFMGRPAQCRIGSNVTFYPYVFHQGSPDLLEIGDRVDFFPYNYISSGEAGSFVKIGSRTHFAPGCVLYGWGGLTIGNCCAIAAHTMFATAAQRIGPPCELMVDGVQNGPIVLEDDVYVAANVTIDQNVRVARGCVIGANAVLTHDTEPYGVYMGVPATLRYKRGEKPNKQP